MASLGNSIESIFSGSAHIVEGLLESVLALLRHVFDIAVGLIRGVVHVSEEVVTDAWGLIEGVVRGVFANIVPITLLLIGILGGVVVAGLASGKQSTAKPSLAAKGKKKRA
ncbi:unnamed protein product [Parajaminaea phylloscopi]